jgi:hypothetical protein
MEYMSYLGWLAKWVAQLIMFLVLKPTYLDLNFKFDTIIIFIVNYFLAVADVPLTMRCVTWWILRPVNPRGAHTDMMYIHVFILVSGYVCISIYIYTILKKYLSSLFTNNDDDFLFIYNND